MCFQRGMPLVIATKGTIGAGEHWGIIFTAPGCIHTNFRAREECAVVTSNSTMESRVHVVFFVLYYGVSAWYFHAAKFFKIPLWEPPCFFCSGFLPFMERHGDLRGTRWEVGGVQYRLTASSSMYPACWKHVLISVLSMYSPGAQLLQAWL